jgi:hypothetical protein
MIKYLGSKRVLVPLLLRVVRAMRSVRTVVDLFAGTSRVGHALKRAGYRVLANDHNAYAHRLAACYVQADRDSVLADATRWLGDLERLPGAPGPFTATYCEAARYLHPKNGARVDAIRSAIADAGLPFELESVLLVALMEAADRVDSTTGVQMAYLKQWAPRALEDLRLRVPDVLPPAKRGKGEAHCLDAVLAAEQLHGDLLYVDPPYNQHQQPCSHPAGAAQRARTQLGAHDRGVVQRRRLREARADRGGARLAVGRPRERRHAGDRPSAVRRRAHRHPQRPRREGWYGRQAAQRRAPVRGLAQRCAGALAGSGAAAGGRRIRNLSEHGQSDRSLTSATCEAGGIRRGSDSS